MTLKNKSTSYGTDSLKTAGTHFAYEPLGLQQRPHISQQITA
jgi:hypothetical protein